jgi:lipoprotein-anchoring transpeptidase ErfK/SrfK
VRRLSPRAAPAIAAAAAIAAVLALALAPPASAANPPSRFPAAGYLVQPSVAVRRAPSPTARRMLVLHELRRDLRPQVVHAIGMRRVGVAPGVKATVTIPNAGGQPALTLTAREAGTDANGLRATVYDGAGDDALAIFVGSAELIRFTYPEGDLTTLVNRVNESAAPVNATAVAGGPLAPVAFVPLAGGRNDNPGRLWYRLNLPIRPFGQTGWIPADAADVRPTTTSVVIRRGARVLEIYRNGRRIFRTRVAVGRPNRKTPLGRFYVAAKYVPPRNALVSTYALELSAPAGLPDFLRGGVVGIHGTPALWSIGRNVSNGCIRVTPAAARRLRGLVPLGSPVRIAR